MRDKARMQHQHSLHSSGDDTGVADTFQSSRPGKSDEHEPLLGAMDQISDDGKAVKRKPRVCRKLENRKSQRRSSFRNGIVWQLAQHFAQPHTRHVELILTASCTEIFSTTGKHGEINQQVSHS